MEKERKTEVAETKPEWIEAYIAKLKSTPLSEMETFEFDWNGKLMNGHHRLTAIVQVRQ